MPGCSTHAAFPVLLPPVQQALDVTTLTIMRILPREVDPVVFNMTQAGIAAL